ncbi:amidophosphoribosyltransferase [Rubeoparvulum massiliense]|uniref:amidophosphoribosyltransferase n=1 Tax=Rubeoparvulum massiliense TaxID=1631346 RepID=UPI00065DEB19|nr:amidophosphoribosyltransferase [Rubeoparvulum massiliense]
MLDELMGDSLHEECGVFGVYHHEQATKLTYYGIHSLQHRGQESAGIAVSDGKDVRYHRGMGLVTEAFSDHQLDDLPGETAIGHVRYTTAGGSQFQNAQPLVFRYHQGTICLAHNGNITNANQLRQRLEGEGSIFQTTSDTEVVAHLIARSQAKSLEDAVEEALRQVEGAFALLILTKEKLIAALDSHGLRPLSIGRLNGSWVVASETCAFEVIGATYEREVEPGEMVIWDGSGMQSRQFHSEPERRLCTFEYIYFARPDSDLNQANVHLVRKRLGQRLYEEAPVEADVVTGVPDSSISAAIGYAERSGIPYELGLIKNRYVGRTFIQPSQELRARGVRMKLSAVRQVVEGKRVVMIDDSIVRGTTSGRIVRLLREAGAKEVHVRISSPPVAYPCFYGIDTSTREELIAARLSVEEIRQFIGADSLTFLSEEGMLDVIRSVSPAGNGGHCLACFNGDYPTDLGAAPRHPYDEV